MILEIQLEIHHSSEMPKKRINLNKTKPLSCNAVSTIPVE
jgi:hypothetical protein